MTEPTFTIGRQPRGRVVGLQLAPRAAEGPTGKVGLRKRDVAEVEVQTKLEQVLSIMKGADRAKDDRLCIPSAFKALAKSPVMVPWLLSLINYERHSVLRRYALPSAESMRLAARVEEALAEASRLYCKLILRMCTPKDGLQRGNKSRGRTRRAGRSVLGNNLLNQNVFESLYFLVCRVVVGCLRDYHPPRGIFTSDRVDQLVAADLGRLFRSTSYNAHGRALKIRRLHNESRQRSRTPSEDSDGDQQPSPSGKPGTPAQESGKKTVFRSRRQVKQSIISPVVQGLVKSAQERAQKPQSRRKSFLDGFGDKRVPEQNVDGSKFMDYNNLVPLQYRRSPLLSILLPSPREVVLSMDDTHSTVPISGKLWSFSASVYRVPLQLVRAVKSER
ncbi:hypothetical protein FOZ63_033169 [Perkinsus olseni]|uniref:Uncharacterized protein n=1 Tax=Perkinsus olseni TaxID=32597 RepID=A0A7J6QAN7_PEROL|nr:hypothetical protein FOZ63_033169 [Perkinsus olseni]